MAKKTTLKITTNVGLVSRITAIKVQVLREFSPDLEGWCAKNAQEFDERTASLASDLSPAARAEYVEAMADDYWTYSEDYPQLARTALFMLSEATFEHSLQQLCTALHNDNLAPIPMTDKQRKRIMPEMKEFFRRSNIGRTQLFGQSWRLLNRYRSVRNRLVHHNGVLVRRPQSPEARQLRYFVSREPTIELGPRNDLRLGKRYCDRYLERIEQWWDDCSSRFA